MMATAFTFLNTTDGPSLRPSEVKLMRAHVTKTNFAHRRRHIAKQRQQHDNPQHAVRDGRQRRVHQPPSTRRYRTPASPTTSEAAFVLQEFRPFVIPAETEGPGSRIWLDLLMSEPALLEASMAVGLRYCPNLQGTARFRRADLHVCEAARIINSRLDDTFTALTDGMLGAVFALAFSEHLSQNEMAWNVHIEGLSQMIKLRQSRGIDTIPSWFTDLLLYDALTGSISSGRSHHKKIVDAVRNKSSQTLMDMSTISQGIARFHQALKIFPNYPINPTFVPCEIERLAARLLYEVKALLVSTSPYIRALGLAIKLFLHLSWQPPSQVSSDMAEELRAALSGPEIKLCSSIDLTVWQFFVGAVAAKISSETRSWFLLRLRRIFLAMQINGWHETFVMLEKGFMPDPRLLDQFKMVWEEVESM